MDMINLFSAYVIVAWAFWCVVSPSVKDGVLGKVLYLLLALAAMSVICRPAEAASLALQSTLAAIGARHFFLKTCWPHLRGALLRRVRCAGCPKHRD